MQARCLQNAAKVRGHHRYGGFCILPRPADAARGCGLWPRLVTRGPQPAAVVRGCGLLSARGLQPVAVARSRGLSRPAARDRCPGLWPQPTAAACGRCQRPRLDGPRPCGCYCARCRSHGPLCGPRVRGAAVAPARAAAGRPAARALVLAHYTRAPGPGTGPGATGGCGRGCGRAR